MAKVNKKKAVKKNTTKRTQSNKKNITKDKLKGTPFNNARELQKAQSEILEETWRKLEKARAKRELIKKDEFSFFVETFRKGMVCKYGEKNDNLVRVSLADDQSIEISISEQMKTRENSEHLLGVLIESTSSSFLSNYLKAMDIVEEDNEVEDQLKRIKKRLQSK